MLKARASCVTLSPSRSVIAVMSLGVAIGPLMFLLSLLYRAEILAGLILALGAVAIWLPVATLKYTLDGEVLSCIVIGRTRWRRAVTTLKVGRGRGGDFQVLPAMVFQDRSSGDTVGTLMTSQFSASDLQSFLSLLRERGLHPADNAA